MPERMIKRKHKRRLIIAALVALVAGALDLTVGEQSALVELILFIVGGFA